MTDQHQPKIIASLIGLKPEYQERYKALHRHPFPKVLDRIHQSNINDYSIFLYEGVLFSYFVYNGSNFEKDMEAIGDDAVTRDWWQLTDPMQQPFPGRNAGEWWAEIECIYTLKSSFLPNPVKRFAFSTPAAPDSNRRKYLTDILSALPGFSEVDVFVFEGYGRIYTYLETNRDDAMHLAGAVHSHLQLPPPQAMMEQVFHTRKALNLNESGSKKVFVTGCFDMLHSGHVAFLQEAATYGDLYVSIGSDINVNHLKGRYPVNNQEERKYMIEAMACVKACLINSGKGLLDFTGEIDTVKPDIFVVNEDGHSPSKSALCSEKGIDYKVLKRIPHADLPPRSTTALRSECTIPFRIDLAGGWLDQPWVSSFAAGPVITISIEPTLEFNERSGMSSSTRRKAIELWRNEIPSGDPEKLARMLFSFENPPGTKVVAGSQDALGIVLPGLNKLNYNGDYWPESIESVHDEKILSWIEDHLFLITLGPREGGYNVLENTNINKLNASALAIAAGACWQAILKMDAAAFGAAFSRSFEAQTAMFPHMIDDGILQTIESYRDKALGWKLSGAGGGGYLILVADKPIENAVKIKIRRREGF